MANQMNMELFYGALVRIIEDRYNVKIEYTVKKRSECDDPRIRDDHSGRMFYCRNGWDE